MKKHKIPIYGFLPLLSIAAIIAEIILFGPYEMLFCFYNNRLDETISIIFMSVTFILICFICKTNNKKFYIICSASNFIISIRLIVSSIMGLLIINKWTIQEVVCYGVCILTMMWFAASLCGAFVLKQRSVHNCIHILSISHMLILFVLSTVFYNDCLVYTACLPLVLTNFLREHQLKKEEKQDEH